MNSTMGTADAIDHARWLSSLDEFLREHVEPIEGDLEAEDWRPGGRIERELLPTLRRHARRYGVYAPQVGIEHGGQGLPLRTLAAIAERCGPHALGSLAINMMAPDEATMNLLETYGTPQQHEQWLRPLVAGTARSCFGMTEPDAGSDPRRIRTTARRTATGWRIDGDKAFTSGADGAAVNVVMARAVDGGTDHGISMFLVPTDTRGWRIVRHMRPMGYRELGGLCEVGLEGVEVPASALLGRLGDGLQMAQARLVRGRLGHAMRWIGIAQAAMDLATVHARSRETFGSVLAERQAVQWWLADDATDLWACRLMVDDVLATIDAGEDPRVKVAQLKVRASEMLGRVVDHAIQVFGGWGYLDDLPLERWYRDARAARIYDGPSEVHRMYVARRVLRASQTEGTTRHVAGGSRTTAEDSHG